MRLFHGGLWLKSGQLLVVTGTCSQGFTVVEVVGNGHDQADLERAFRIPDIMEPMGRQEIDVLKLDIEGAEKLLFTESVRTP